MTNPIGTKVEDNLISGDFPRVTLPVTILSGEDLTRGTVLGKITSGGKYKACNSGHTDGAEVAECVLAGDVDATLGDTPGIAYLTGSFTQGAMAVGALPSVDTVAAHINEMRLRSLFQTGGVSELGTIT